MPALRHRFLVASGQIGQSDYDDRPLRLDAALYAPAPNASQGKRTIPQERPTLAYFGAGLGRYSDSLEESAHSKLYGEGKREVEITSGTAVWYHSGMPALPIRWVLIRDPLGKFKSQALLCTDLNEEPEQILKWFVMRWQLEVTFHEVRDHLGVETQRQWSDWAILRTTPALLGLFSLVTLLASTHAINGKIPFGKRLGIAKPCDLSDALAFVRQEVWQHRYFQLSHKRLDVRKLQPIMLNYLCNAAYYTP